MKLPGICCRGRDSDNCSGYATGHESPGRLQRVLFRGRTIVRITPPVKPDPGNPDYPEPEPEQFIGLCPRQVESRPDSVQKWRYPVQALGGLQENPNKFSASRHRPLAYPNLKPRFWGATTPPATPHGVTQLLCGILVTVSYRDLFGFYGIFCWSYVNHAIFSTIHEFLQLFNDLLSAEIINVFMGYMATGDH